jgi:hypothetical protein
MPVKNPALPILHSHHHLLFLPAFPAQKQNIFVSGNFVIVHGDADPQGIALQAFHDKMPEGTVRVRAARLIIFAAHKSAG